MKKPERWRESTVISQSEGQAGYNIAFDKWEAYHKQEMDKIKQSVSVEKITKHIEDNFDGLFYDLMWFREGLPSEGLISLRLAIAIHKLIGE